MRSPLLILSFLALLIDVSGSLAQPPGESPRGRQVVVPGNVEWTNTMLTVKRGEVLRFDSSGQILLSFDGNDVANASGAAGSRSSNKAPIPTSPAGALIGRVGRGRPFPIGNGTAGLSMPDNGRLFLGINDDHVDDNSGNYVVKISAP